ncbi:MAG: hypothetical protein BZY88_06235 [SAR202 cluster bacterium Io17-Chloro-G9]|nr:MAG: hypothetical protein BZY88_06235 [SAR202 cluster bacterium Io17-Chloro-G9]
MGVSRPAGGDAARSSWLIAGVLLIVLTIACSGEDRPALTEGAPRALGEILEQSVARLLALESVAFTLEQEKGITELVTGVEMSKAYGVVDIPDRFSLTVEAQLVSPRIFLEIGVIVIGDQAYVTDLLSSKWGRASLASVPVNVSNLGQTLADITKAIKTPVLVGPERVSGRETYHIKGSIQSEDLAGLVPGAGQGFKVDLDMWLDRSDNLLVQAVIEGKVVPTDIPDARRLLTLDEFDVPVDITAPE